MVLSTLAASPEFSKLTDGIQQFGELGKKYDYDIMKMAADPDLEKLMSNEEFNSASEKVQAYLQTECGIGS